MGGEPRVQYQVGKEFIRASNGRSPIAEDSLQLRAHIRCDKALVDKGNVNNMRLKFNQLVDALQAVGLDKGATVMIQSSLKNIGPVEGAQTRNEVSDFYYRAFRSVIGHSGTLLVHTPFESYGRFGSPFDVQNSPSTAGILSEYIRNMKGAVRSRHPIVSVAGIGPRASEICDGNHLCAFGWDSPWGRMHRNNVRFITLGFPLSLGVSFLHYVEAMYQVPYQYIKIFNTPISNDKEKFEGPFMMNVRYLDFSIQYNYLKFEKYLFQHGMASEQNFERGLLLQSTTATQAFDGGLACLRENIFAFLHKPPVFRQGEIPADGITGEMKWVYDKPRK